VAGHDLELGTHASAEAQVAAISDDIAYNNHDLADGLRAKLFTLEDLRALPLIGPCIAVVDARWPGLAPERREHEALRRFFGLLVEDVLATSRTRLADAGPRSAEDVRTLGRPVIRFSDATFAELKEIRAFLYRRMYRHWSVQRMRRKAKAVVRDLFATFLDAPELMPDEWNRCAALYETARARVVADYIAGMTDRFALQEHRKLSDPMVKG
jgi:dGTPase